MEELEVTEVVKDQERISNEVEMALVSTVSQLI